MTRDYRPAQHAAVTTRTTASPAALYALLCSAQTWPTWINLDSMTIEREGHDGGETVGAVRLVHFRRVGIPFVTREQVVELIQDRRFSYSLVSGLPLHDYRADVDLVPLPGGGTHIDWSGSWRVAPGLGPATRVVMRHLYRQFSAGLAQAAEGSS